MAFRDRFFTPRVARAITSPSGVLLLGAGTALGILGGLPILAATAVGAVAYGARVAAAIPRRPAGERIDPFAVGDPWRRAVIDAQQAKERFDRAVRGVRPGPLRERLSEVGGRIADGVVECWRIAKQGDALEHAWRQLDTRTIQAELQQVSADERHTSDPRSRDALARARAALESQLGSAERIAQVARDATDRLRVLNAQLDEAVARAIELSVPSTDASALSPLSADVDNVVGELESLRLALEETGGTSATYGA